MTASIQVNDRVRVVMDPIKGSLTVSRGVLLTLEGKVLGDVHNCVVIPLEKVREVVATLQLVAHEAARA